MRKISYWARLHPLPAVSLIVFLKITLAVWAVWFGYQLRQEGMLLPSSLLYVAGCTALLCIAAYPDRKRSYSIARYYRQKSCDFLLTIASFVSIAVMANHPEASPGLTGNMPVQAFVIRPTAEQILQQLKENPAKKLSRSEKKILKKEFNKQLLIYAKAKLTGNKEGSDKSAMIILTIIAAIGLGILLASLVCSLSCNGSDAAAVAVALIGGVALIWGTIAIIRSINRKKNKGAAVSAEQ